jgi:choline-sulfatase
MTQKKPNILWICTDQQRYDAVGCYGNEHIHTPHIDKLASRGVLFENAYAQSPICTPSRSSFLTGRYPRTTRCRQNGQSIPADERLITKSFHDAGYVCGLSGKLHLSACHPEAAKTRERRIDDGYDLFYWSHDTSAYWPSNEYLHWLAEQNVSYQTKPFADSKYIEVGMPAEYHQTTWCFNKAATFIKANQNHPWFFSVNVFDPHAPFNPPESYLTKYIDKLDTLPLPHYKEGELDDKPHFQKLEHEQGLNSGSIKTKYTGKTMTSTDHRYVKAAYYAMIELIDDQIGSLLKELEETEQLDNTIIIFMSDHGELLGDHGLYYKGPFFYDPSIRVPLIITWRNHILAGRRSKALIELVDIAPTLLDAADLPINEGIQGKSLWSKLIGEESLERHKTDIYCEYYNALPWNKPGAHATMIRTERYKLVAYHGLNEGELYDLEKDPDEYHNLWHNPDYTSLKLDMMSRLCDRMAWTVDPLPLRQSSW